MKRILIMLGMLFFLLPGCNKIKNYPTSVLEMSAGGEDNSTYSFENGTIEDFVFEVTGDNMAFKNIENSDYRAFMGNKCLRISAEFKDPTTTPNQMGGIIKHVYGGSDTQDLTGKTITIRIWIPNATYEDSVDNPYGASFYVKGTSDKWYDSTWQNLILGGSNVNGVWTELSVNVDDLTFSDGSLITEQNSWQEWGVKIAKGDASPEYSGYIYVDSIDIK